MVGKALSGKLSCTWTSLVRRGILKGLIPVAKGGKSENGRVASPESLLIYLNRVFLEC